MLVHLESLEEWANGDIGTMKEIIHLFVDNTPPTLDLLQKAIEEWDWEQIVKYAHKLKSSYGIVTIGNSLPLIQDIEQAAREKKDEEKIKADFQEVRDQFATAVKEFDVFNANNP
jgi:HPt (histidine-containing phosphotransfer) domain-containing protein